METEHKLKSSRRVKKIIINTILLHTLHTTCNQIELKHIKDCCTKEQYEAIKVLRRMKWTKVEDYANNN